jgi:hypothetical protein
VRFVGTVAIFDGGAATSSTASTTISGDEEFFTTAAHGFHHVDDVAERRVVAERGDFLSSEMAARFGPDCPWRIREHY